MTRIIKQSLLAVATAALTMTALTGCSLINQFLGGNVSDDGDTSVFDLRVGDCVNNTVSGEAEVIASMDTVDCSQPHDFEVFALLDFSSQATEFPGQDAIDEWTWQGCLEAFTAYTGLSEDKFYESDYDI